MRHYTRLDQLLIKMSQGLHTLTVTPSAHQPNPAATLAETSLTPEEKKLSAGLMRVNHVGEVCAQALYQGQAFTAHSVEIKKQLQQCAEEENDHLAWCHQRLNELNSHTSYLNPLWYSGALLMGMMVGLIGDQWSLGFIVETEKQVEQHLKNHLEQLPVQDQKSRAIVAKMQQDEAAHAMTAKNAGAYELSNVIKRMMRCMAKCMTTTAYWI